MQVGADKFTYEWIDNWVKIPDTPGGRENGRTHGVVVSKTGNIMVFHQANPAVVTYSPEGEVLKSWGDYPGAHGMSLVEEGGVEYLWLTDETTKAVDKCTLDGEVVLSLTQPPHPAYGTGKYIPTWVAVNETRHGGNGDIWLADGYGSNLVHRFDASGAYLSSLSGAEGEAGEFSCPHGIAFDTRSGSPLLYIADRSNKRVQVYDAEGNYQRVFGQGVTDSPCGFVFLGEENYVPELFGRLAILDARDELITYVAENAEIPAKEGWPNFKPDELEQGKLNSPHGMAVDPKNGDIYVVEWIIGGRITKLARK